jgi:hypothetical protein
MEKENMSPFRPARPKNCDGDVEVSGLSEAALENLRRSDYESVMSGRQLV